MLIFQTLSSLLISNLSIPALIFFNRLQASYLLRYCEGEGRSNKISSAAKRIISHSSSHRSRMHIDFSKKCKEEEKEHALSIHSEKLAIAFAFMHSGQEDVIRIVKNLRACRDCHNVTKLISKVYGREIIVRDRNCFHHFKDGECSCMDYW